MRSPSEFRTGKPGFYPDQSVYAEFACAEFGLRFRDLDGGSGLLFSVASRDQAAFISAPADAPGIRRTVRPPRRWHPTSILRAGSCERPACRRLAVNISSCTTAIARIARRDMNAATRSPVSETLGGSAFVKPLTGSRGDFAQAVHGEAALVRYLDEVAKYYDADPDPADRRGNRVSRFPARRRRALLRAKISAVRLGRWRAHAP